MHMDVLAACMYVYHICAWCPWRSDRALDLQKLELQIVMSHHIAAGNGAWVLCKSSKYSKSLSHLSSLVHSAHILLGVWLLTGAPSSSHGYTLKENWFLLSRELSITHSFSRRTSRMLLSFTVGVVWLELAWVFCLSQLLRVHMCGVCCVQKAFLGVTDHLWLL